MPESSHSIETTTPLPRVGYLIGAAELSWLERNELEYQRKISLDNFPWVVDDEGSGP
jgi:hypothetical protein